jgi:hypothetical protein
MRNSNLQNYVIEKFRKTNVEIYVEIYRHSENVTSNRMTSYENLFIRSKRRREFLKGRFDGRFQRRMLPHYAP